MNEFDLTACPLSGSHCISAGAGTGKTYAIAHLFLRLLLEKEYSVDSILVVTFTEAATKELHNRIRSVIKQALDAATGAYADTLIGAIVQKHIKKTSSDLTKTLLYKALYQFDEAPICTIHSFCRRILKDNAFESSMRFDTELISDQQPIILEAIQDFWRITFFDASPHFVNFAQARRWSPQKIYNLLFHHLAQPDLEIVPKMVPAETSSSEKSYTEAFSAVAKKWPVVKNEVRDILLYNDNLNKTKYRKDTLLPLFDTFDAFISHGAYTPDLFKGFDKFTMREILHATKKDKTTPEHEFFRLCDTLYEQSVDLCTLLSQNIVALKYFCFEYVIRALDLKKQQNNISTFDDLLTNLYNAIKGSNRKKLISSIRKKYNAALIDEFQDTDPVQYAIFKPLFSGTDIPLFLIGDPKQAIYSFRGADIFTFISAAQDTIAENQYTLQKNYRSSAEYIKALNTVFLNKPDPFVFQSIPYFEAKKPHDKPCSCRLTVEDKPVAPLTIWYLSSTHYSRRKNKESQPYPITKETATDILCKAVTGEIARILMHGIMADKTTGTTAYAVNPSDIAVLVRTKYQAREIKQALSSANIPAVLHNAGNIFDTIDAREINHLLHAIAYPYNHGYVRSALCTSLIGMDGNALYNASEQENSIESFYDEFKEYHDLWNRYGFIRMFTSFMSGHQVRKKLLSLSDGARRLTNVLHIQDLLQQQSTQSRCTMQQLLNWFSTQLNPNSPRLEEHELRLEKDDNAVQVVTIHKSKGLQYPVVFCPFTWSESLVSSEEFIFHDGKNRRVYEIGGPDYDQHKKQAEKELLAENIRLLYVALSRTKYQCYLAWGRFNKSDTSAPAYIFHRPDNLDTTDIVSNLAAHIKKLSDQDMLGELVNLSARSEGATEIIDYKQKPAIRYKSRLDKEEELQCRIFQGAIPAGKRLSSFSSLIQKKYAPADIRDIEEFYNLEETVKKDSESLQSDAGTNIFTFPKGPEAGNLLHGILEQLDFAGINKDSISEIIKIKCTKYGFAPQWHDTIHTAISNMLTVNLVHTAPDFSLSLISNANACREMEFYYPLKSITAEKLCSIFKQPDALLSITDIPEHLGKLDFQPAKGFMRGFIDLLFAFDDTYYIIDWKSNHLGDSPEFYAEQNLKQAMLSNSYYLQYYIYTLAVDRYLHSRIKEYSYDKHFGGVFYIFLRGISEDTHSRNGIFFDKPDFKIIERLNRELIGE